MSTPTSGPRGPILRLAGFKYDELPSPSSTPEQLTPFLALLLQEALPFVDSIAPISPASATSPPSQWKQLSTKSLQGSTAPVALLRRSLQLPSSGSSGAETETWIARVSTHADDAEAGTANWQEFRACIKDRHAETEKAFTPTFIELNRAAKWDCGGVQVDAEGFVDGSQAQRWGDFTLDLIEVRHAVGRPVLADRTFPVLQMTCAPVAASDQFIVVTVPISDFAGKPEAKLCSKGDTVVGAYAAVERVRKVEAGSEWIMATASDAGGVLPRWIQDHAVPGQIAKDVPKFLTWLAGEREKGGDYLAPRGENTA